MNRFGPTLKIIRKSKDFTLRGLALKLDLSPAYICDIEHGRRNPPDYQYIEKMKDVLKLKDLEFMYLCNLAGDFTDSCPPDILSEVNKMDESIRFEIWNNVRKIVDVFKK